MLCIPSHVKTENLWNLPKICLLRGLKIDRIFSTSWHFYTRTFRNLFQPFPSYGLGLHNVHKEGPGPHNPFFYYIKIK